MTQDRKPVALSAPSYIDSVMSSIQNLLDDDSVFPTKSGTPISSFGISNRLTRSFQDKTSIPRSPRQSSTSTASFYAYSHTFITLTTSKFSTSARSRISTPYSPTSLRLDVNMSCSK